MENNKADIKDKIIEIKAYFENERKTTDEDVFNLISDMNDNIKVNSAQLLSLRKRQVLIEMIAAISDKITFQKNAITIKQKNEIIKHNELIQKYDWKQKEIYVNALTANESILLELLINQRDYYINTIKTLDSMQFAIKHKIELLNLQ